MCFPDRMVYVMHRYNSMCRGGMVSVAEVTRKWVTVQLHFVYVYV